MTVKTGRGQHRKYRPYGETKESRHISRSMGVGGLGADVTGGAGTRRGVASPPASMWLVGMLACRSCVSAVAVEALMDNVREEGKLELTEGARA